MSTLMSALMETWGSYSLTDFLMFSPASYFRQYTLANSAYWPFHLILPITTVMLIWIQQHNPYRYGAMLSMLLLSAGWLFVVFGFLYPYYAQLNVVAEWFALTFLLLALLLILLGIFQTRRQPANQARSDIQPRPDIRPRPDGNRHPGMLLFYYALLLHPLVSLTYGHGWQAIELYGVAPDATALATLGILLTTRLAASWLLILIPLSWCLVSGLTHYAMNNLLGLLTPTLAVITIAVTLLPRKLTSTAWR